MRKTSIGIGTFICAALAASAASAQTAASTGEPITVTLSGTTEVPGPGDADGSGTATLRFNTAESQICYELKVNGIAPPNGAHIHVGASGESGGVKVPLETPITGGMSSGCAPVDKATLQQIMSNPAGYYVNVHNAEYPNGAIRGQLAQ